MLSKKPNRLVLDLRSPADFDSWHLPHSINVPLESLSATTPNPFVDPDTLAKQWREHEERTFNFGHQGSERAINQPEWLNILSENAQKIAVTLLCYDGDTSRIATSVLRNKGIEATSIKGGRNAIFALYSRTPLCEAPPLSQPTSHATSKQQETTEVCNDTENEERRDARSQSPDLHLACSPRPSPRALDDLLHIAALELV